ncbi:MAG: MBL fold metallo-hydrolase [Firmicutes bacterium]|nr:MBL fold metallo-hydrolase [Bacillota bacterium]
MKITVLVENSTENPMLGSEHGLSLYIETLNHRILFDAGDSNLFEKNANMLGIDLSLVDIFILSHGHHDHGGGLNRFIEINQYAKIYVNQYAFQSHYSKRNQEFVDISVPFPNNVENRLILNPGELVIDDELMLFSRVEGEKYYPSSNKNLYTNEEHCYVNDDFKHEQNLIIKTNEKYVLVAGCAHHGMLNIIHQASHIVRQPINVAIGGLHLYSRSTGISESEETVKNIGKEIIETGVQLFTCHCTGDLAYKILEPIMKTNIKYIRTGFIINI